MASVIWQMQLLQGRHVGCSSSQLWGCILLPGCSAFCDPWLVNLGSFPSTSTYRIGFPTYVSVFGLREDRFWKYTGGFGTISKISALLLTSKRAVSVFFLEWKPQHSAASSQTFGMLRTIGMAKAPRTVGVMDADWKPPVREFQTGGPPCERLYLYLGRSKSQDWPANAKTFGCFWCLNGVAQESGADGGHGQCFQQLKFWWTRPC